MADQAEATSAVDMVTAWPAYADDAVQRSILLLDLLRQRGNNAIDMAAHPTATVLRFGHEEVMNGHSLPRPMNYALLRILPPEGCVLDPRKRPVVVVDPRAGEGPGIGGFKEESEIGDALRAGHPVYFIAFSAAPEPGQQFLDVVEGQIGFFERVVALHPEAPPPFAIGNCQAGYQTLMVAMLRPDLFGPCLLAGSPMSFWQGVRGKDPMRYAGGLSGGSWLTALTSDLGCGKFDGSWLVLNFDNLGPANFLWGKQYDVFAAVDTGGERYLTFERWWGDFVELNGDELQFLVDQLFIGDKLMRNQLTSSRGDVFDVRHVTAPIIVFASSGDNISPPPQSLGWIADVYRDVEDIRAGGQAIVYCLSAEIGHLAIFVSSKVGAEQDEEFVLMVDVIDCLPPGLYEMVIAARPDDVPKGGFVTGDWIARLERRTVDDIRALGRNSAADDRAFAAVARLSEINLAMYRRFLQPWVRATASQPMADLARSLNPLRLGYTMFADRNPWMWAIKPLAACVASGRRPVAAANPFLAMQERVSERMMAMLNAYRDRRDRSDERRFFGFYGSPYVQALLGIDPTQDVRPVRGAPQTTQAARPMSREAVAGLRSGGFAAALTRTVLHVLAADGVLDQRCALALNQARQQLLGLSLAAFKAVVREQATILRQEPLGAVEAIPPMLPKAADRRKLLTQAGMILSAAGAMSASERGRLAVLARLLGDRANGKARLS